MARRLQRVGGAASLLLTASYVFAFLPLGLMDISATSPFSAIRMHGGSNHLLLPTGLLQRWMATSDAASTLSGGIVRVESFSTSVLHSRTPFADQTTYGSDAPSRPSSTLARFIVGSSATKVCASLPKQPLQVPGLKM